MKKLLAILLCLIMALSMAACGTKETETPKDETVGESTKKPGAETSETEKEKSVSDSPYDQEDVIYIGSVQELTGSKTVGGIPCSQGIQLAVDKINASGGVLGKQIVLVEEDGMETPQDSITALTKLLDEGKVSGMLTSCFSSTGIALSPTIRQYEIPTFSLGSSANVFAEGNPYMWQVRVTDNYASVSMIEAAVSLGIEKPGIIHTSNSYGMGLTELMETYLKDTYNTDPSIVISFNTGETNFAPLIAQLMDSGCDGIIAVADAAEATLIMKQIYSMNIDLPCIGSSPFASTETIANAGEAAVGWYSVAEWSTSLDTDISKEFVADYEAAHPGVRLIQNVAYAYDATFLLFEAIKIAGTADPAAVNEALAQIQDYEGVISTLTPDENRSFATSQLLVQTQADGNTGISEIIKVR